MATRSSSRLRCSVLGQVIAACSGSTSSDAPSDDGTRSRAAIEEPATAGAATAPSNTGADARASDAGSTESIGPSAGQAGVAGEPDAASTAQSPSGKTASSPQSLTAPDVRLAENIGVLIGPSRTGSLYGAAASRLDAYRQIPLWLSRGELESLISAVQRVITPLLRNEPSRARRQYLLSPILFPEVGSQGAGGEARGPQRSRDGSGRTERSRRSAERKPPRRSAHPASRQIKQERRST